MPTPGAFDRCFVALLARLWAEMETVIAGLDSARCAAADARARLRAQALLLELHLLADRCASARWRALLAPSQIEQVRHAIGGVAVRLDFDPFGVAAARMREALVEAQNYVFDAVHGRCLRLAEQHDVDPRQSPWGMQSPFDRQGIVIHDDGGRVLARPA